MSEFVDVLIIGAGLSGLQAALDLHEAGRSIVVLEARDRVGGKTNSVQREDGKGIIEIGAAWFNDSNQSHLWNYVQKFSLTPVLQNIKGLVASEDSEGNCHMFPFGELPRVRMMFGGQVSLIDHSKVRGIHDSEHNQNARHCRSRVVGCQVLRTAEARRAGWYHL